MLAYCGVVFVYRAYLLSVFRLFYLVFSKCDSGMPKWICTFSKKSGKSFAIESDVASEPSDLLFL